MAAKKKSGCRQSNGDADAAAALMREFGDPPDSECIQFDADGNEVFVPPYIRERREWERERQSIAGVEPEATEQQTCKVSAEEPTEREDPFKLGESPTYDLSNCAATWQLLAMKTGAPDDVAVAAILTVVCELAEGRRNLPEKERLSRLRELHRVAHKHCDHVLPELERSKGADGFAALLSNSRKKGATYSDLAWLAWNATEFYLPGLLSDKSRDATELAFADKFMRLDGSTFNSDEEWSMAAVRAVLRILGDPKADDAFKHRRNARTKRNRNG